MHDEDSQATFLGKISSLISSLTPPLATLSQTYRETNGHLCSPSSSQTLAASESPEEQFLADLWAHRQMFRTGQCCFSFVRSTYRFLHAGAQTSPLKNIRIKDFPTSLRQQTTSLSITWRMTNETDIYSYSRKL